jgi:CRISPR/Cas system-associated exonuclease Cas4 (RecB family)
MSSFTTKQYDPASELPFKLSRSKIELFMQCPRCFYLDRRLSIARPSIPGYSLNSAVDTLLKNEFDLLRSSKEAHAIMKAYGVDAIPFDHPDLSLWRTNFTGRQYLHEKTNLLIFGAVDDLWVRPTGELIIVDYKSTSTDEEITLEGKWKEGYKRQLEIYQWIFRSSGFDVSDTAYIVYANASKHRSRFDGRLEFALTLHSYIGGDSWVERAITDIKACLEADTMPIAGQTCEYCEYTKKRSAVDWGA